MLMLGSICSICPAEGAQSCRATVQPCNCATVSLLQLILALAPQTMSPN